MITVMKLPVVVACIVALAACGGGGEGDEVSNPAENQTGGNGSAGQSSTGGNGSTGQTANGGSGSTGQASTGGSGSTGQTSPGGNGSTGQTTSNGGNGSTAQTSYTVTASAGAGGTIRREGSRVVPNKAAVIFTITPDAGYGIANVGGTCGGTLSGNTYTTQPVTANCTVQVTFTQTDFSKALAACFTVVKPVKFVMYRTHLTSDTVGPPIQSWVRSVGPATFKGQPATESTTRSYVGDPEGNDGHGNTWSQYWNVTGNGITMLGRLKMDGNLAAGQPFIIPLTLRPGQFVDLASGTFLTDNFSTPASYIFVGLESITHENKKFSDVCRFRLQNLAPPSADYSGWEEHWYAPGYGEIQLKISFTPKPTRPPFPGIPPLPTGIDSGYVLYEYARDFLN